MTETEIEQFINKARKISFQPAIKPLYLNEKTIPGQITLRFKYEYAFDGIEFVKGFKKQLDGFEINAQVNQVDKDKINLALIANTEPVTIITVTDLTCNPDSTKWFYRRQPKRTEMYLGFAFDVDTMDNYMNLIDADPNSEMNQPIHIKSWDGNQFIY